MSAAVDHPISQALIGPLHYVIEEEDEEEEGEKDREKGEVDKKGGQLVKHWAHSKHVCPYAWQYPYSERCLTLAR